MGHSSDDGVIVSTAIRQGHEDFVPLPLAERYVNKATEAGDKTRLIVVPATGHFESASPASTAWPTVLGAIRSLLDK